MSGESLRARGIGLEGGATGKSGRRRGCSSVLSNLTASISSMSLAVAWGKMLLTQETPPSALHLAPEAALRHTAQAFAKVRHEVDGVLRMLNVLVMVTAKDWGDRVGRSHWEVGFRKHCRDVCKCG